VAQLQQASHVFAEPELLGLGGDGVAAKVQGDAGERRIAGLLQGEGEAGGVLV